MCVHAQSLQSCPVPCDPVDCSLPGSSVHGILQVRIPSGLLCPSSDNLPNLGIEPVSLMPSALAGGFFTTSTTWEAQLSMFHIKIMCSSNEEMLMIKINCQRKNFTFFYIMIHPVLDLKEGSVLKKALYL